MPSFIETPQDTFFLKNKIINCNGKALNLDEPAIMGILNLTPDSFYDGGKYINEAHIVESAKKMVADGALIIDVGGYSTRPGANNITEREELNRVIPVIKLLKEELQDTIISIDTFRSSIAEQAVKYGASVVNDISGGTIDENMFKCVSELNVPYILMHIQGTPQNMQENPTYKDVVSDVLNYFDEKLNKLNSLGVNDVIIDPGFGFGKTIEHNYKILNHLDDFKIFNQPVLTGISRKGMIYKPLNSSSSEALNGTTVANTIALMKGTNILRVHDVKEAKEAIDLVAKLNC